MKAYELLKNTKEQILIQWESLSIAKLPKAHNISRIAIRDHIPCVFSALCAALESGVLKIPEEHSRTHGRQRSWSTEYSLTEVMAEYSFLKNIIFDELTRAESMSWYEFRMISDFFDSTSAIAAAEFVKIREHEINSVTNTLAAMNLELETYAAIAAHDLRSPISTILGFADIIFERTNTEDEVSFYAIGVIKKTAHRMLELIDQLLSYAKVGKEHLIRSTFSLNAVAHEAKENLAAQIQEIDAQINIEDLPNYEGDAILFRQLFQNLISNSLKFHSPHRLCQVSIKSTSNKNEIQLQIKDNGIGFDPKLNEMIFQPFNRGNNRSDIQGSGLGLATAKKIVDLHGGKISAVGQSGKGTEVFIILPYNS